MNVDDARFLFLKLNIWLCLASGLMVTITAIALEIPLSTIGLGVALPPLLFYFIYVEDRRRVSAEDEVNQPRRTALVRAYQLPLLVTEAVALLSYEGLLLWSVLSRPDLGAATFALGQLPLVVLAVYGPFVARVLKVTPPGVTGWAIIMSMSLIPLVYGQAVKELEIHLFSREG